MPNEPAPKGGVVLPRQVYSAQNNRQLNAQQVYALARQAGATHDEAIRLTAIAKGESSWRTGAHYKPGGGKGEDSYGIWQINMDPKYRDGRMKTFGIASLTQLYDPIVNAKAALHLLRTQGWNAWTQYSSNKYKANMAEATAAGNAVGNNFEAVAKSSFTGVGQPIAASGAVPLDGGGFAVSGGGVGANELPENATPDQIDQYIREHDPDMAGFLDVPDVRAVLIEYAQAKDDGAPWDQAKLNARIAATPWYRTHGSTVRTNLSLRNTDPASWEEQVQREMARLKPDFEQLGSDVSLRAIAEASLTYGWNEQQLMENFAGHLQYDKEHNGLKAGSGAAVSADSLAAIARNEYLVPLMRGDVEQWAIDIFSKKRTQEQFRAYLADQAEARFPGLKERGITPGEFLMPIKNAIAAELEMSPAGIDLLSPRWSAVLQVPGDGKSAPRPMTYYEALKFARSQTEYQYTKGARDEASKFTETLGKTFGLIG